MCTLITLDCLFAQPLTGRSRARFCRTLVNTQLVPWREASRSRPEGGGTPRRMQYTLGGSNDRERRAATLIGTALAFFSEHGDHHDGPPGAVQQLLHIKVREPLHELEGRDLGHQRAELLREDDPRQMVLAEEGPGAVLLDLEQDLFPAHLADQIGVA